MTCRPERRNLRPPSCCKVLVINGGLGEDRYGLSSTLRTVSATPSRPVTNAFARASVSTRTSCFGIPLWSKSFPVARRAPSTAMSFAANTGWVFAVASISKYVAARNAIRSRSRSTTKRKAGLCTRPADRPRFTRRHKTGDTSYP